MQRLPWRLGVELLALVCACGGALAQPASPALTWEQVKAAIRSRQSQSASRRTEHSGIQGEGNHGLPAARIRISPLRSTRSTPSPATHIAPSGSPCPCFSVSYLHERQHKRELRLESAQKGHRHRDAQQQRSGAHSALQSAQRLRAGAASQSASGDGPGRIWTISRSSSASTGTATSAGDIAQVDLDRV